jgi:hypothetical protein
MRVFLLATAGKAVGTAVATATGAGAGADTGAGVGACEAHALNQTTIANNTPSTGSLFIAPPRELVWLVATGENILKPKAGFEGQKLKKLFLYLVSFKRKGRERFETVPYSQC